MTPKIERIADLMKPLFHFFSDSAWAQRRTEPGICDFVTGNPQELPLPAYTAALQRWIVPQNKDWFAYKDSEPEARHVVAASLRKKLGVPFATDDIIMTTGASAALAIALNTIIEPSDEVILITPPWFSYEARIIHAGGITVRVPAEPTTFDLDIDAIAAAITAKTRCVIINTPNNPTGKIYSPATLEALAALLTDASERNQRPIYILSDEPYNRIVFDDRTFYSPTCFYPNTFLVYSYGKTLLTPGQKLGYLALPPQMPNRDEMRAALTMGQFLTGYAVPNALLQHALCDIEPLSIDIAHLQCKRDRLVKALREANYRVHMPEGTFYLLPQSPWADDRDFVDLLAEYDVFCLPGVLHELPGYFRICLTATDEMIERAIPKFAEAMREAMKRNG